MIEDRTDFIFDLNVSVIHFTKLNKVRVEKVINNINFFRRNLEWIIQV